MRHNALNSSDLCGSWIVIAPASEAADRTTRLSPEESPVSAAFQSLPVPAELEAPHSFKPNSKALCGYSQEEKRFFGFACPGDFVRSAVDRIRPDLDGIMDQKLKASFPGSKYIFEIDLRVADMIDAGGVNYIFTIQKMLAKKNIQMRIIYYSDNLRRILDLCKVGVFAELIRMPRLIPTQFK